jgi:hypothetical protein
MANQRHGSETRLSSNLLNLAVRIDHIRHWRAPLQPLNTNHQALSIHTRPCESWAPCRRADIPIPVPLSEAISTTATRKPTGKHRRQHFVFEHQVVVETRQGMEASKPEDGISKPSVNRRNLRSQCVRGGQDRLELNPSEKRQRMILEPRTGDRSERNGEQKRI